jgi:hypothetical protein
MIGVDLTEILSKLEFNTKQVGLEVTLYSCILEVLGLNHWKDTGYARTRTRTLAHTHMEGGGRV